MNTGRRIGYVRESHAGQSLEEQTEKLRQQGCEVIQDNLPWIMGYSRPGDVVVVTRLDRLADSMRSLGTAIRLLRHRQLGLIVLEQNLDTTVSGDVLYDVMAEVVAFDRSLTNERITIGLAKAKARGIEPGPKKKLTAAELEALRQEFNIPGVNKVELAHKFGLHRSSLYRLMQGNKQ
ncbi:MAG TPA: recombinase family protein [Candidatus Thiothrix moscowensis]|uniref:recombinase family protein n=1 Tax=unclassified Thiothrix TaxID=2636184 RepID=UPI0025F5CE42|nr:MULTISPECIES: recombinase family protein [unclassified Thiothrix]HRJ52248.1 recombinase family protein [Candidatus Thiothrix moscowensis]HRJ92563.1 recombinase family protein [Candidatus Thiothrix moscowensis]